jgi:hypothetical protein
MLVNTAREVDIVVGSSADRSTVDFRHRDHECHRYRYVGNVDEA